MSSKLPSLSKQLVIATALVLGASGAALADDSSMSRFGGDSYQYFNGQFNRPAPGSASAAASWRQSHPNGLSEAELQAASASGLSTVWATVDPPVFARAPADPSWRKSHPSGLTEHELQAMSSSELAVWQAPIRSTNTATASIDQPNVAQNPGKETFATRLAKMFHREGAPAGSQY
jgi:hypothetical protein